MEVFPQAKTQLRGCSSPATGSSIPSIHIPNDVQIMPHILERPSSLDQLLDYLEELKSQLVSEDPPSSQYLLVRRIPAGLFSLLVEHPEVPKGVRATIFHHEQEILYKIMPWHYHAKICRHFDAWIHNALGNMGLSLLNDDFWLGGDGRSPGRVCSKEADAAFFPGREPVAGAPVPWPSLVLEVGISESVPQLRADARWWYSNSNHQTQIVVLVSANPNSHNADIEIWTQVVNRRAGPTTRGQDTHVLECTKSAKLRNGVLSGDTLTIDFQTLMGRSPQNPQETDLQLTSFWVQKICQ